MKKQIKIEPEKVKIFFQQEIVLCIALFLALISSVIIPPDEKYISYIDFRTLAILFSLMCVMAELKKIGVFQSIANTLLKKVKNYTTLIFILVMLCFLFSMLITNDVALITFVPFTFIVLKMLPQKIIDKIIIPVIVLQTIAANLGSMLTPIGNPQNLFLYELSKINFLSFILIMLPYTLFAFVLLSAFIFFISRSIKKDITTSSTHLTSENNLNIYHIDFKNEKKVSSFHSSNRKKNKIILSIYLLLFFTCLLSVTHILSFEVMLATVVIVVLFTDKRILLQVDYSLLFTFIGFFIFIGNMNRIQSFYNFISDIVQNNEMTVSIFASQIISNVPTALLLSSFTQNYNALIIGTNLGGLGTLIGSMASLISYKLFAKNFPQKKGRFIAYFSIANAIFLVAEIFLSWIV